MLKRRSSVRNSCRIESSNRLKSIFIKFNGFIFFKYFCKGGPGPWGPPLDPPLPLHLYLFAHLRGRPACLSTTDTNYLPMLVYVGLYILYRNYISGGIIFIRNDWSWSLNFEIKTFPEVSRSRPRPDPPGLETKTKT